MYLKDFTGPEGSQKRLWAGFLGTKTVRKTERPKRRPKTAFGPDFGRIWEAKTAKKGSKNEAFLGSAKRHEKITKKGIRMRRAVISPGRLG